ncbi:hypothetical protein [Arthrobacter sp. UYCu723]
MHVPVRHGVSQTREDLHCDGDNLGPVDALDVFDVLEEAVDEAAFGQRRFGFGAGRNPRPFKVDLVAELVAFR